MKVPQPLLDAVKAKRVISFIGAGFSRVFGLPTWSQLINQVAGQLGMDPDIANLYGDFLQLAECLSIEKNGISGLRSELDKSFNSSTIDINISKAHLLLPQLKTTSIYTTNWDNLIERSFEATGTKYNKIVDINDFVNDKPDLTSIVKFHGDLSSNDDTLVFTEESYFERLGFETPLDIRLRSDMIGNTLLFLGYSLSDFNVRFMWFKLQKLLTNNKTKKHREHFAYIAMVNRNPVFETISRHSRDMGVIFLDSIDPQNSMVDLLETLVNEVNS